jgi:N-acetylglucosamine kinase-like BadF-type ATPase
LTDDRQVSTVTDVPGVLVFGADGGGTKTLGILARASGEELAHAHAGPSNQNVIGTAAAAKNLAELIMACSRAAGRMPSEIGSAVFGLAGAGSPEEREALVAAVNRELKESLSGSVETDARIALEGAFAGEPGVVVIAGTGSVVIAKSAKGEIRHLGGWGRVLGDEGSGYFLGLQALRVMTRDFDGIASSGTLRATLEAKFGWTTREALIAAVYRGGLEIPALAPLVLAAAAAGDAVATEILRNAAALLADQVAATFDQLGARAGVVFVGGLIDHESAYAGLLREAIVARCSRAEVRLPRHPPVVGAVLMARARLRTS